MQAGENQRNVLIAEMGHRCTCIALVQLTPTGHTTLGQRFDPNLGCLSFDMAMFDHLVAKCKAQYNEEVLPKTKKGIRLLAACERIRKLLSTIPEARHHVCAKFIVVLSCFTCVCG